MKIEARSRIQASKDELQLAMFITRKLGFKILSNSSNFGGFVRFNSLNLTPPTPNKILDKLKGISELSFDEPEVDLLKNISKGCQISIPFSRQSKDGEATYNYELWINTVFGVLIVFER